MTSYFIIRPAGDAAPRRVDLRSIAEAFAEVDEAPAPASGLPRRAGAALETIRNWGDRVVRSLRGRMDQRRPIAPGGVHALGA